MGEAIRDNGKRAIFYMLNNGNPENLLHRFSPESPVETKFCNSDQPDLTLRLSLGGIYCEKSKKSLNRSSSIAGVMTQNIENGKPDAGLFLSLARSCSLPSEIEQQSLIKLKEVQSMSRMKAKKRLVEQRSGRAAAEEDKSNAVAAPPPSSPSELAAWAAASAAKSPALCRAISKIKSIQECSSQYQTIEGQGGMASAKGCTRGTVAANKETDKPLSANGMRNNPSKKARVSNGRMQEIGIDVMKTMPSVMTIGDGPNGRKVEGFLYKYMKGEEVCIVCVCHGSFLSPAEFVKHAGGCDVANPMKHINVCATSFSF